MKNVKLIVPIISLVCAAVVCGAVLLWAPVCAGTLELANGNMVPMRCAYTAKVAVLLALVLAAVAVAALVTKRPMTVALVLLSSLLAACVTAFAGPISFVGIAVPHLVKQALGSAKPLHVLPGCALGGAAFCLLCDLIARSLFAPTELSISSVTAVFGAPVVIWLLVRRQSGEGRA